MMNTSSAPTSTAFPSIVHRFGYSPIQPAIWRLDPDNKLQFRNLALDQASEDVLKGVHYRAAGINTATIALGSPAAAFSFLFVVAGKLTLKTADSTVVMTALDSACRYGSGEEASWTLSHDAEVIQISALPGGGATLGFQDIPQGEWQISQDDESNYTLGEGPRKFFKYRDLGVAAATNRRVHIHVVRATQSMEGGTGWHSHSMGQLFYVLRGWADLAVQHQPWVRMGAGDAMCVAPRMAHDVPDFSPDYLVLEMCIPADYDTVDGTPK